MQLPSGTGWLGGITISFTVVDKDGATYYVILESGDSLGKHGKSGSGSYSFLDFSKKNPVAPGGIFISKKIPELPDTGFGFLATSTTFIGMYYCEACQDSCGGYSTGMTSAYPDSHFLITPGLAGNDSFEYRVPLAGSMDYLSVVRVSFYPGNPPPPGQGK